MWTAATTAKGGEDMYVPTGRYRITSQVTSIPVTGQNAFLRMFGDCGGSELVCSGPATHYAFSPRNSVPVIFENLVFLSPTATGGGTDMRGIIGARSRTIVRKCNFVGHSLNGAVIVSDDLFIEDCEIAGVRATFGAIAMVSYARLRAKNVRIIDYGYWKGVNYSKSDSNNLRWIFVQDPITTINSQNGNDEGLIELDNVQFDENAHAWLEMKPSGPGPDGASLNPNNRCVKVIIKNSGGNLGQTAYPNFRGFLIRKTDNVLIEETRFGWADASKVMAEFVDAGHIELRRLRCIAGGPNPNLKGEIIVDSACKSVRDEGSDYATLTSPVPTTGRTREGITWRLQQCGGAVPTGALVVVDPAVDSKVIAAPAHAVIHQVIGVALEAGVLDKRIRVADMGQHVTMISDGVMALGRGAGLAPSKKLAGRVSAAGNNASAVGRATANAPATVDVAVSAFFHVT